MSTLNSRPYTFPAGAAPAKNPFSFTGNYGVTRFYTDSENRRECVRTFTEQQCLDALQLPDLQTSVRKVIERRLSTIARSGR